ncbi:MAG: glycosyltransferase [Bacteroidota bacterium]
MAKPEVIICPLNWGLGHATRMIPLIRVFQQKGFLPVVAADGDAFNLLIREFEGDAVRFVRFPGKIMRYSYGKGLFLKLLLQSPSFLFSIWRERDWINRYVKKNKPCLIISDNRYGVRSPKVFSVFVGHQLNILPPERLRWLNPVFRFFNHAFIKSFDQCWVPDFLGDENLSGILSHGADLKHVKYTGALSRFRDLDISDFKIPELLQELPADFITVILSGPEPQRTLLENQIKRHLKECDLLIFRGLPGKKKSWKEHKHLWFDHADAKTMLYAIKNSRFVISRSGYTTLMDLYFLRKKSLLIPTPGQTEQEYLANYWEKKGWAVQLKQDDIHLLKNKIDWVEKMENKMPEDDQYDALNRQVDQLISFLPCQTEVEPGHDNTIDTRAKD